MSCELQINGKNTIRTQYVYYFILLINITSPCKKKKKTQSIGEGDNFDDLRKYIYHSVINIDLGDLIVGGDDQQFLESRPFLIQNSRLKDLSQA